MVNQTDKQGLFNDFVEDLNFIMEKDHITVAIPVFSMWGEYVCNLLIKQKFGKELAKNRDFILSLKLKKYLILVISSVFLIISNIQYLKH